jgi:hypothetical protein
VRRTVPALVALALLAGCGSSGAEGPPAACLAPAGEYLSALEDAPGEVRLAGGTAISECFTGTEDPGVGQAAIRAATVLNAKARKNPSGADTVRLGYLDGAVRAGAANAGGADADLVRRLDAAARFSPGGGTLGAAFERAFGKGYAAGEQGG